MYKNKSCSCPNKSCSNYGNCKECIKSHSNNEVPVHCITRMDAYCCGCKAN